MNARTSSAPLRVVVMGPSGSGKTTVGRALAAAIGAAFVDADDLHPLANVEKMASGVPLDDADRMPWLRVVSGRLQESDRIVVACSALKRIYRDALRDGEGDVFFAELAVDRTTLADRVRRRAEHFMPSSLLDSQLQTLESLEDDERGIRVDGAAGVEGAVALIVSALAPRSA